MGERGGGSPEVHSEGSHVCDVSSTTLTWLEFEWLVDGWLGSVGVGKCVAGGLPSFATGAVAMLASLLVVPGMGEDEGASVAWDCEFAVEGGGLGSLP